jgi:hypothetical protein
MIALGDNPWTLIILTLFELLLILIPPWIASKIERNTLSAQLKELGANELARINIHQTKLLILGLIFGIGLFFFGGFIYDLNILIIRHVFGEIFLKNAQENRILTTPIQPTLLQFIIILLLQIFVVAFSEEFFFRAFLIKKFNKKFKPFFSLLISSLIFTLYHTPPFIIPFITIITFFGYYFILGILLSLLYYVTDYSILQNITAHGLFNILILIF